MTRYWKCVVIIHLYKIEQICCPWHILKFYLSYHVVSPNRTLLVYTVFCWCQGILVMHVERLKPGLYSMQMPMLAAACASPLHSASCAVDESINRRPYASVYVRIRPYQNDASALGDLGALLWLAGMPALVCAGLESSTSLNFVGDSRRMCAYALGATGDRSINSCADSRRIRAHGV